MSEQPSPATREAIESFRRAYCVGSMSSPDVPRIATRGTDRDLIVRHIDTLERRCAELETQLTTGSRALAEAERDGLAKRCAELERERDEAIKQRDEKLAENVIYGMGFNQGWSKGHGRRTEEINKALLAQHTAEKERDEARERCTDVLLDLEARRLERDRLAARLERVSAGAERAVERLKAAGHRGYDHSITCPACAAHDALAAALAPEDTAEESAGASQTELGSSGQPRRAGDAQAPDFQPLIDELVAALDGADEKDRTGCLDPDTWLRLEQQRVVLALRALYDAAKNKAGAHAHTTGEGREANAPNAPAPSPPQADAVREHEAESQGKRWIAMVTEDRREVRRYEIATRVLTVIAGDERREPYADAQLAVTYADELLTALERREA